MNCYFCQKEINQESTSFIYKCNSCYVPVQHFYTGDPANHTESLWCLQMWLIWRATTFLFLLYPTVDLPPDAKFRLYIGNMDFPFVELDYMPDITPDNLEEWADRFINLKSFA